MKEADELSNPYCPRCGAPLIKETVCLYCSDAGILAERRQLCLDFLNQMNKELEYIPGGYGWLILLVWWGIPILVTAGYWVIPGKLSFVIWFLLGLVSFFVTTILAAGMREMYRQKIYSTRLSGLLEQFLLKNRVAYDYMLDLANSTFPEKSAIREKMMEGKKLEHLLQ
ncbi:MAG: hypothetical protein GYA12_06750 [Chloroflexi bacterium]|nr:hypothetical protein [Chloroflexota bacterium]